MHKFNDIIKKHNIKIPIIQRDYVQGRTSKKTNKIRKDFLNSIFKALNEDKKLHLEFIYGNIKENCFIPLDGQQRLTTIFLIHWYFSKKEAKEISQDLSKFTYETRASSREFCNKLVSNYIDFEADLLSAQIKDSSWFLPFWENDPTIKAMLVTIDDIHAIFGENSFYDRLDNIVFDFLPMEEFNLDDDLYIKMNARGKPLTDFENFKAAFEKHLTKIDFKLKEEFSTKIDNIWTDYFWSFSVKNNKYIIDDFFMRYFSYLSEMLYYRNNRETLREGVDFQLVETIYTSKDEIRFLFDSLDNINKILSLLPEIFSENEYAAGKVCLFDKDINLLEKMINGKNLNIQESILLFIVINYFVFNKDSGDLTNLLDLLRIARNLTYRNRHRKTGKTIYTNDMSYEDVQAQLKLYLSFINKNVYKELAKLDEYDLVNTKITKNSFEQERSKAQFIKNNHDIKEIIFCFEDLEHIKGDIYNFLTDDVEQLTKRYNAVKEIFSNEDSLIIRSMLTENDYALKIGWTYLGDKYFFGKKEEWEVILTARISHDNNWFRDFFESYLDSYYENGESLEEMISTYLKNEDGLKQDDMWRYHFVKYPEMTTRYSELSKDRNVYSWKGSYSMEKMGGSNLNAYHLNPFIHTAAQKLTSLVSYMIQYDDVSYLEYGKITIYSLEEGWGVVAEDGSIPDSIINKFNMTVNNEDNHILEHTDRRDRIEIIEDFICDLESQK